MSDILIQQAVAEIILTNISPSPVPTMTLVGAHSIGATTAHLSDVSHLVPAGRLDWWDNRGERSWAIRSVDPVAHTVALETKGLDQLPAPVTGLLADHADGALVSTNIMTFEPARIGYMLVRGDPAIFVVCRDERPAVMATRAERAIISVHIEVRRSILQSVDDPMDDNDWTELQQELTRKDLNAIETALINNRHLTTSTGPNAQGLGSGGGPDIDKAWGVMVIADDNQQFVGSLDVTVRDKHQII